MSTLNINQIMALLDAACTRLNVDEPTQINIECFTREEAFKIELDDATFIFTDGRPVDFYLTFSDHPDYCFIYTDYSINEAQNWIEKWITELNLNGQPA